MTSRCKYQFSFLVVGVLLLSALAATGQDDTSVSAKVTQLGMGGDDVRIVKSLSATPQLSVQLLIKELHTVNESRELAGANDKRVEHVLWCIRALRYVTGGLDFCGKTSHQFGTSELEKNRRYWLYFKNKSCVPFFAMRPSRGSEYIAPQDAQEDIIDQWERWLAREGKPYQYVPLKDPKPEAWLW